MNKRELSTDELDIVRKLLSKSFPGSDELRKQLQKSLAAPTQDNDNYGSIYLLPDKSAGPAEVSRRVPVEALVRDVDGGHVNILLHVVDGYLNELEIVKLDATPLNGVIDASKMKIIVNQ